MAASVWNQRNLTSPPIVHLPVSFTLGENVTLQKYQGILTDMTTELRLLNIMQNEAWAFQRVMGRYAPSERNMKWFRECKSLGKSWERLLKMKIERITTTMLPLPETDIENSSDCKSNRWPSCQMLEYFLARLVGFAALCQYIWSLGYKTNQLLLQNMEKKFLFYRHFYKVGCISRMQILAEHLLEKSCCWYTALFPYLQCLPKLEADWLPEGITLPKSIEEALGSKLVELRIIASQRVTRIKNAKKSTLDDIFGMREEDDMLPLLVLKDDVSNTSGRKKATGENKCVDMSLDDIFTGLVHSSGDIHAKRKSTLSNLKQEDEKKGEDQKEILEESVTSQIKVLFGTGLMSMKILEDEEVSAMSNTPNRGATLKKKQMSQPEDLGVPVLREEVKKETIKKKKKELKRKKFKDNIGEDGDTNKRSKEQPMEREDTPVQDILSIENDEDKRIRGNKLQTEFILEAEGSREDRQMEPAQVVKKRKKKRKRETDKNISDKEIFDEGLTTAEYFSTSSNVLAEDAQEIKKKRKKSDVGIENAKDEGLPSPSHALNCQEMVNLNGERFQSKKESDSITSCEVTNGRSQVKRKKKKKKTKMLHGGTGVTSPVREINSEVVMLGSEAGRIPKIDSDVTLKKKKKKKKTNRQMGKGDASYSSQQSILSTEGQNEHEQQSKSTMKRDVVQKKKGKKKKKKMKHATLEVDIDTNITDLSWGVEQTENNDGLDLTSAAQIIAGFVKSKINRHKKKKTKHFT